MDYNNDGYLDLLAGDRYGDNWLFDGSASGLQTGTHILAGGDPINTDYNCSPYLVDWDEDGYLDLLIGGYPTGGSTYSGFLHLYMNSDTSPDVLVYDTYTELSFWNMWRTTHEFHDLDRDGDKDLILGNENGMVYFAPNTGTNDSPVFNSYAPLEANGSTIDVGARARETVNDWNEDGIPDLVICNTTNDKVQIFLGQNTGIEGGSTEVSTVNMSIQGNPGSGVFHSFIEVPADVEAYISVYDIFGRMVTEYKWNLSAGSSELLFDLSAEPSGPYYLTARIGSVVLSERLMLIE
ncbi:MAG: hypothetical protein GF388_03260 [Candidatus Aegiribacteria sp.]|nr:hypothetical protein [Candidatus Aegiribacteria sp.]MBD3294287.1 hypothetical protein [Candidatus Fermentibacteria bacterium]